MKKLRKGFTLIELMVVVIIMGILASMSIPYYTKTVETSRATDAVALGNLLGAAYRIYKIDWPAAVDDLSGSINNCNPGACSTSDKSACRLVNCKYMASQDWSNSSYGYSVGNSCGGGIAACVSRVGGNGDFATWGYSFSMSGGCQPTGGTAATPTPSCPKF